MSGDELSHKTHQDMFSKGAETRGRLLFSEDACADVSVIFA
jgi:hypothetical protein